jgi:hypothetical protein
MGIQIAGMLEWQMAAGDEMIYKYWLVAVLGDLALTLGVIVLDFALARFDCEIARERGV